MSKEPQANYQGLSRLYRPQTFASVLGQESIVITLKNALRQKKTAQAYLFSGTRGTGKTTLARVLAKALNCQNLSIDSEPCNECPSCLGIMQGRNLNVFEIDGASNRGIDDIRQLNETIGYAPSSVGCKIFIIDEAHMLTKEAFNALLKTLEEPPPNVKFFLATTESHKIPLTIVSRCQRFELKRIPTSKIAQKLMKITDEQSTPYEEEAIHRIASLSDGSMRVAESLLDQILCFTEGPLTEASVSLSLSILPTDSFFDFDKAFEKHNLLFAFTWAELIFSSGKDLPYFLECLLEHYRNILAVQMKLSLQEIPHSLQKKYQDAVSCYTEEQTLYILDYLLHWHQQINKTPFKRVNLEMVLLHILKSKYRVSAAELVFRIEQLQEHTPRHETSSISEKTPPSIPMKTIEKDIITDLMTPSPIEKTQVSTEKAPPPIPLKNSEKDIITDLMTTPIVKEQPLPTTPHTSQPVPKKELSVTTQAKHETLMRFASIELEGTLTKN